MDIVLIPYTSPGVNNVPANTLAHTGFLTAFNSVVSLILSTFEQQLNEFPGYTLISTGHSLGGALASLGALSLKSNFPDSEVILYTFGMEL